MVKTYDALEGELSVRGAASASRTGETSAVALVGGYDANNAASGVNAGEATEINNPNTASDTFGDSEIPIAAQLVSANGVNEIHGVPLAETSTTESISNGSSITLANTPLFDPTVHPDHDVTVTDTDTSTDLTVNVVYDSNVSTPSAGDEANVNPITGDVEVGSSGNYDITYTYSDDYSTAIETAAGLDVRNVVVLNEAPSVKSTLLTELQDRANDFDFHRGYTGATPDIAAADISSYTPDEEDWRMVEVVPSRCTRDGQTARTVAAVAGFMANQPISPDGSGYFEDVSGFDSLNREYRPNNVKDFDGVTALDRSGTVARAVTTSTTSQFENIYAVEVIDEVALTLFGTARDYAGGPQDLADLEALLSTQCQRFARGSPPLLGFGDGRNDNPYDVSVSFGATNDVADAGVTIVPFPIAEEVNLDITVADGFVEFGGANA